MLGALTRSSVFRCVSLVSLGVQLRIFFHRFYHLILMLESVYSFSLSTPGLGQPGVGRSYSGGVAQQTPMEKISSSRLFQDLGSLEQVSLSTPGLGQPGVECSSRT